MPAEAAADVVDISHRLDVAADGFVADTQCHAEFFGADFIVFLIKARILASNHLGRHLGGHVEGHLEGHCNSSSA